MSGIAPSSDPGMPSRSRSSQENPHNDLNATLVSSAATGSVSQQIEHSPNHRDATLVEGLPHTSLQASLNNCRRRHQLPQGFVPGDSTTFNDVRHPTPSHNNPFVGSDVPNTHHFTALGDHASSRAFQSLSSSLMVRDAAMHMHADLVQVAAFERDTALAAIPHNQKGF